MVKQCFTSDEVVFFTAKNINIKPFKVNEIEYNDEHNFENERINSLFAVDKMSIDSGVERRFTLSTAAKGL